MEKIYPIQAHHSAKAIGSGGLDVLSTPMLVAYFENCAYEQLQKQLAPELTSVGGHLEIFHLAPSRLDDDVKIVIDSQETDSKKVVFSMSAYDSQKKIAQVKHTRYIVNIEKFMDF